MPSYGGTRDCFGKFCTLAERWRIFPVVSSSLAIFLGCASQATASSLLLISIDGLRPDYVTRADEHGLKIPNLRRFIAEGSYAEGVVGVLPTITYPSTTTLVTGVWP